MLLLVLAAACEREQKAIETDLPMARETKARADAQQIASAVRAYQATFGVLPDSLDALTRPRTTGGVTSGPFLAAIPAPPRGWTRYEYARRPGGLFSISASGGGAAVSVP